MSRTYRNSILLLAVVLGLSGRAFGSSTATITVNGAETAWDASTITISFNSFVETVSNGQFSTQASLASAFAAMFSRDYLPAGLCANASGNVINFKLKVAATFGTLSVAGSKASFQLTSSGFLAAGSPVADTGTVTLTANGTAISTANYGHGATPAIVAQNLADGATGNSLVTVTAVNDALYIESKTTGAGTDFSYSVQNASFNTSGTNYTYPSFPASPISGNLDGGAAAQTSGTPPTVYSFAGSYDGVGNLLNYTDNGSGGLPNGIMGTWNFQYDTLNRVALAADSQPGSIFTNYCWSYDSFGNRWQQMGSTLAFASGSGGAAACPAPSNATVMNANAQYNGTVNGTNNNQMSQTNQNTLQASGYDAAGDVTNDGVNQYLYDAEGRICAVSSPTVNGMTAMTGYLYDADGTRVAKGTIQNMSSCDPAVNHFQTTNDYILGPGGEQVTEMAMDANNSMAWLHTNVYAAGSLIATYDGGSSTETVSGVATVVNTYGLHFYFDDPLGTRRAQTDYAGVLEQTCSSLPFGDGLSCTGSITAPTEHHFTGKERDTESGNDYFGARYYSSSMGRWMSPDPGGPNPSNPQALNLYRYGFNNPMRYTDPDGFYERDVHFDLTQVLAYAAGYSSSQSSMIGRRV